MSAQSRDPRSSGDLDRLDEPVRRFLERIAGPASSAMPDVPGIQTAIVDLAADADYWTPYLQRLCDAPGSLWIHAPLSGPRLALVHRPEGQLSAVHDHGTWVALSPILGRETHRRFTAAARPSTALPRVVEVRALDPGDALTLLPPDDVHDHGHVVGQGSAAHVLILTGDDQRRYRRREWDLATGRHRVLAPGESGRWLATDPVPGGR